MSRKVIIFIAFVLYLIPLYFGTVIFAVESALYAAMFLSLSFFITEPYKKWFRRIGLGMICVVAAECLWILFVYVHIPELYFP